jgi:hypothetical protein
MRNFVERLRNKPEHIRRRVAVGTAVGITGVVTATWLFGLTLSGNLALAVPKFDGNSDSVAGQTAAPNLSNAVTQTQAGFAQLLGAAGVATATTAPASLTVEDAKPAATQTAEQHNSMGQTVIPF